MEHEKQAKEIADSYLSSLIDLTINSKPLINMLTILAEENIEHGQVIVDAVQQHIAKIEPDVKLPVLYLIDSIVKNVGREYVALFSHSIVNIFCGVFEKVNEKIRQKMFTLRQTWNEVFPPQKLYALDVKVNSMDPGWPITQKVSTKTPSIHVNPNFFKSKTEEEMQAQLQIKQRELLELQKRKLELELAATQKHIEEKEKQLGIRTASISANIVNQQLELPMKLDAAVMPVHPRPATMGLPPTNNAATIPQMNNIRQRIAPVNAALVSSVCSRDPRLMMRGGIPNQGQPAQSLHPTHLTANTFNGAHPRISNFNNVNNGRNRIAQQRFPPTMAMAPFNPTNNNNLIPSINENALRDSKDDSNRRDGKSTRSSTSSKYSSKSTGNGGSSGSKSSSSVTHKSSPSSRTNSSKSSSRSSKSSSSSTKSSGRSTSKSKDRSDDRSPQRKKSRRRSPSGHHGFSSSSKDNKSPKKSTSDSKSSPKSDHSITSSQSSSKALKDSIKSISSNTLTKNHDKSKSPLLLTSDDENHVPVQDVDLRSQLPVGLTPNINPLICSHTNDMSIDSVALSTPALQRPSTDNNDVNQTNLSEQTSMDGIGLKDVDLRVPSATNDPLVNTRSENEMKRPAEGNSSDDEKVKKSKSKIDILFGTEDVDLRTLTPAITTLHNLTPPPPPMITNATVPLNAERWANMKFDKKSSHSLKNNLNAVRAKLAEATKNVSQKNANNDVDLRDRIDIIDDDSQDGEAKLKMMMMQAHEQVESENLNKEQIQSLLQQIIQVKNETHARKSFKRMKYPHIIPTTVSRRSADEAFSSDSDNEELKQSHRVLRKRTHSPPSQSANKKPSDFSSPKTDNESTKISDEKPAKERRQRKSKWSGVPATNSLIPPPLMSTTIPFPMSRNPNGWQPNHLPFNPMGIGNPQMGSSGTASAVSLFIMPSNSLLPTNAQIVMAQHGNLKSVISSKERTINIDNVPREIRYYDEVAIAFMDDNGRVPKEIGFQSGDRRLCVDDKDTITLSFNDAYKQFIIDGKSYQIRFGSPTRELYIDNEWYECYFGEPPVGIYLDNKLRVFKIDGPPPQVRIGNLRKDLVAGRVDMYIDSMTKVSLFLDAQAQAFSVDNQMHTIQFADYFLTAIIDNIPFPVKYGEMPAKFKLQQSEHYIRFSVLPSDIVPGKVFIRNMIRTNLERDLRTPPLEIMSESIVQTATITNTARTDSIANEAGPSTATTSPAVTNLAALNISELLQKLVASGVLNKTTDTIVEKKKEKVSPILLSKPETLKKRQSAIVHALFSGMQCSSCGVRFPPEQTMKYSQHLDWHYRQNRRERDSARRAHSRKWYYEVSDWIQYEEIENLDEREKNWFETQQTEQDPMNEESNQRTNSPLPSCVAGPEDDDKICDMCHDQFETFFHEETEEWHLRNAIRVDNHVYHPICYEDHKTSLTLDDSAVSNSTNDLSADDNAVDIPIKAGEQNTEDNVGTIIDDDDDVIVVAPEEPVITEIPDDDDDDDESMTVSGEKPPLEAITGGVYTNIANESDIQILEPAISVMDLDQIEDEPENSIGIDGASQPSQLIKIKSEPKYDGYEDEEEDTFEVVGTFDESAINEMDEASEADSAYTSQPIAHTSQTTLVTTLDGNVEVQDAPTGTIGTNRIKINITKNVQLNKNAINSNNENIDINLAINSQDKDAIDADAATAVNSVATDIDDIEYTVKGTMQHVLFKPQPPFKSGFETSGLCSIM